MSCKMSVAVEMKYIYIVKYTMFCFENKILFETFRSCRDFPFLNPISIGEGVLKTHSLANHLVLILRLFLWFSYISCEERFDQKSEKCIGNPVDCPYLISQLLREGCPARRWKLKDVLRAIKRILYGTFQDWRTICVSKLVKKSILFSFKWAFLWVYIGSKMYWIPF